MRISQITIVGAVLIFSSLFVVKTVAQPRTGGTGGSVKTSTPPSGGSTPTRKTKATVQIVYRTVEKLVTATTGSLSVGAEANATLLVELLNSKKPRAQQGQVPSDEKIFIFNNLPPGRYRVAGTLEGYHPVEKEVVVVANKSQSASLDFKPVLYSLIVRTNISNGELKYAPQGRPLTYVTPIQNGRAQVELKTGKYDFQITAAEFGYETLRDTVDLGANKELNVPLKRIVNTTDTLAPNWTAAEIKSWQMPAAWTADAQKKLLVKGSGVALPRDQTLRYYKNFKISSTSKMVNGVSLSFALRAQDQENYYLLQLTGEKSDEPNTVRLFVVKNNVEQRLRGIPIPGAVAKTMAAGKFFSVSVKVIDFAIRVEIEDSDTGASFLLGVLTDPAQNFPVGAVGIAGRNNEDNVIGRFVVCTGDKCLSE